MKQQYVSSPHSSPSISAIAAPSAHQQQSPQQAHHNQNSKRPQFFDQSAQVHFSFISKQHLFLVTEQTIRQVFEQFSAVQDVCLKKSVIDPITKEQNGYGFVHYPLTQEGIQGAIQAARTLQQVFIKDILYDCCLTWSLEAIISGQFHPQQQQQQVRQPQQPVRQQQTQQFSSFSTGNGFANHGNNNQQLNAGGASAAMKSFQQSSSNSPSFPSVYTPTSVICVRSTNDSSPSLSSRSSSFYSTSSSSSSTPSATRAAATAEEQMTFWNSFAKEESSSLFLPTSTTATTNRAAFLTSDSGAEFALDYSTKGRGEFSLF
jgi:hypothetical protein